MAHAMAVERTGHEVMAVYDENSSARSRIEASEWVNEWGTLRQILVPRYRPHVFSDFGDFASLKGDLLIISSPTASHVKYVRKLHEQYDRILCEKPVYYSPAVVRSLPRVALDKLFVGHNHMLHPGAPSVVSQVCVIRYAHEYAPLKSHLKECGVWWDLGTHCLAMMLSYIPGKDWPAIRVMEKSVTPASATATFLFRKQVFIIEAAYTNKNTGFLVDGHKLQGADVFGLQIQALAGDFHPANALYAYGVTRLANAVHPFRTHVGRLAQGRPPKLAA